MVAVQCLILLLLACTRQVQAVRLHKRDTEPWQLVHLFHTTTPPSTAATQLAQTELVWRYMHDAAIIIHTVPYKMPSLDLVTDLQRRGCNVSLNILDEQYFENTPLKEWYAAAGDDKTEDHVFEMAKFYILFEQGGLLLDRNVHLLQRPPPLVNFIGQTHGGRTTTGIMGFESAHPFLQEVLKLSIAIYNPAIFNESFSTMLTFVLNKHRTYGRGSICTHIGSSTATVGDVRGCTLHVVSEAISCPVCQPGDVVKASVLHAAPAPAWACKLHAHLS